MRGLRIAVVMALCAGACAKHKANTDVPAAETAPAPGLAQEQRAAPGDRDDAKLEADEAVAPPPPATLDELSAELDGYEVQLREAGVRLRTYRKDAKKRAELQPRKPKAAKKPTEPNATPTTPSNAGPAAEEPCTKICAITEAVCSLRERICDLADEHDDDERYHAACGRAERDCARASEACDECAV